MQLSVADYNRAEEIARALLPNRAVEAFQPVHFNTVGYPTRVRNTAEIAKYAEVMHEGETASHVRTLGGLSDPEWKLVASITSKVWNLTSDLGRPTLPQASLLRSVHVLRRVQQLYGGYRPRVFELGPGTGYLGALLSGLGYPYAAMDISEGFYLYQNACWNTTNPDGVVELALVPDCQSGTLSDLTAGKPVHVPWWHFASLKTDVRDPFDLVICNRALCEMNPTALQFSLRVARAFLSGTSSVPKAFLFDGWGANVVSNPIQVLRAFLRAGFAPAYLDEACSTGVFVPSQFGGGSNRQALAEAIYLTRVGQQQHASTTIHHVFEKALPNRVSDALAPTEELAPDSKPFGLFALDRMWRQISDRSDHRSPDELFWDAASFPSFLADSLPADREIYLFGAGSFGQRVSRCLAALGRPAHAFLDNDRARWGQRVAGLPVQDPCLVPHGPLVLVTTGFWREVSATLTSAGRVEGADFFVVPEWLE